MASEPTLPLLIAKPPAVGVLGCYGAVRKADARKVFPGKGAWAVGLIVSALLVLAMARNGAAGNDRPPNGFTFAPWGALSAKAGSSTTDGNSTPNGGSGQLPVAPPLAERLPHPRSRDLPDELIQQVKDDPNRNLPRLVDRLVEGIDEPARRAAVLHDWIALNIRYDVQSYLDEIKAEDATWQATVRRGTSVCHGYAELYRRMCGLAGLECVVVPGHGRGYDFLRNRGTSANRSNHAWNAVRLRDGWHLVDVTWDAGYVNDGQFHRRFSRTYFMMAPRHFVYTHLPTDPRWQLLEEPLSTERFLQLPYLKGVFFERGLRLESPVSQRNEVQRTTQLVLAAPADVAVTCQLENPQGQRIPHTTLVQPGGPGARLLVAFPRPGAWTVDLFAGPRDQSSMPRHVASLLYEVSEGTAGRFPQVYGAYGKMQATLLSPLYSPLQPGTRPRFQIRVPDTDEVFLVIDRDPWRRMERDPQDRAAFQLTADVDQAKSISLVAKVATGYTTLVEYRVADGD